MLFLYYIFFVISVVFHFGFEGETVVLIKISPGNSLLFIFQLTPAVKCRHNMQFIHKEGKALKDVILSLVAYV